jgi:ATP-dependent DNA helicase Rep
MQGGAVKEAAIGAATRGGGGGPIGLNSAQREAVHHLETPCLVLAGAGSGKTRVIASKIAHLIDDCGVLPTSIAAITFTNKAAREMLERASTLIQTPIQGRRRPLISTFHALGVLFLRTEAQAAGLKPGFSIFAADDSLGVITQALGSTDRAYARAVQSRVSLWKNALLEPDDALAQAPDEPGAAAARAYREYAATLSAYQAVDFDDLIRLPVRILERDLAVRERWQRRLRYLLIDEVQDTNAAQYAWLRLLAGPLTHFTAVGDDDQAIYGWRGATLENLQRLSVDYPTLKVIKLEQNYRSCQHILHAANQVIQANPKLFPKTLWSELGPGDPVTVSACADDEDEAERIAVKISALKFERRGKFSDFAVLYRSNQQARVFEQALRKQSIPYTVTGGTSFFDRAEVRDLIAYLRLLVNDDDDPAFIRAVTTPRRGIGAATLEALGALAGERHCSLLAALFETAAETRLSARALAPLREFGQFIHRFAWRAERESAAVVIDDLLTAMAYRDWLFDHEPDRQAAQRWQNVCEFVDWIKRRAEEDGKNLLEMAQLMALVSRLDGREDESDAVRLSTLHAAKGLEWPHVFLAGVEEGLLPSSAGLEEDDADPAVRLEEERRLMYVGITRAQRSLHVSWCRQRKRAHAEDREPSRFIAEMGLARAAQVPTALAPEQKAMSPQQRIAALQALLRRD